jgi:hypothetical protein
MTESDRARYLRPALILVGLKFIVGLYLLTVIWPSGWSCILVNHHTCR